MPQPLHLVFGQELTDPTGSMFKAPDEIRAFGIYPEYATAYNAWTTEAQRTVDTELPHSFIASLRDEDLSSGRRKEIG